MMALIALGWLAVAAGDRDRFGAVLGLIGVVVGAAMAGAGSLVIYWNNQRAAGKKTEKKFRAARRLVGDELCTVGRIFEERSGAEAWWEESISTSLPIWREYRRDLAEELSENGWELVALAMLDVAVVNARHQGYKQAGMLNVKMPTDERDYIANAAIPAIAEALGVLGVAW